MALLKSRTRNTHSRTIKPLKYEMTKRKEDWKSISGPLEEHYVIPIELQASVIKEMVSPACFARLVSLLGLPPVVDSQPGSTSIDTAVPIISAEKRLNDPLPNHHETLQPEFKSQLGLRVQSEETRSSASSQYSPESLSSVLVASKQTITQSSAKKPESVDFSDKDEALSYVVEVDKRIPADVTMMMKHKAILRFLGLPEAEVASWRTKEAKGVEELCEMTLEQQGDFLINKIAAEFCDWMRGLGGSEKSFINEEILKELFEICMDNPASRAICIKTREKKVLYYKLAEFLKVPKKSFHEVLSSHLNWDAKVERMPSKLTAFNKSLPKDLRFKTPKNKTSETWLEWNKFSPERLSFADIYSSIKDLRSTQEYCRWLLNHPEHKRPQFLVDEGFFEPRNQESSRNQDDQAQNPLRASSSTTTAVSVMSGRD